MIRSKLKTSISVAILLAVVAAITASCSLTMPELATTESVATLFYASQSGRATLDQGEGGGNPFASALIELLERPSLTYSELSSDLIYLTQQKSRGFQKPEVMMENAESVPWIVKPTPKSSKRVALVFVYSNYEGAGVASLPGADRDLERVALALKQAGFDVVTIANPTKNALQSALESLSKRSATAEAAVIYVTGHGFEHDSQVYLAPNDYPFEEGPERLSELAIHIPSLTDFLKAKMVNLVFYGGCRSKM